MVFALHFVMQLPITVTSAKPIPLQQQLVDQIHALITQGVLRPGVQIPSSRNMAHQLGLSRRTVVLSYERLMGDGLIETRPAHGTFVCGQLPSTFIRVGMPVVALDPLPSVGQYDVVTGMGLYQPYNDRPKYDFRIGRPDATLFPHRHWRRLTLELLDTVARVVSDYTHPSGHPLLRSAIANHLRTARGIACQPEHIIITAGAQEGLNLAARLMQISGQPVLVEDPCYSGAAQAFLSLGGELVPVAVTADGIDTDALPPAGTRLGYVTPSHQFPLGVTMSQERRVALIGWARRTGTLLVEDDYDSDFRHNSTPLAALQALGPECVVYLGTFSKSIGPGLRIGYAVFPAHLAEAAGALKSVMNNGHPWLEQAVLAQFITSGAFERHLSRMRTCYRERRNVLVDKLRAGFPGGSVSGDEGGMHLVWDPGPALPSALDLQLACRKRGVGVYSLAQSPAYRVHHQAEHDRLMLLGYAGLSSDDIASGVLRIQQTACEMAATRLGPGGR